MSLEATLRVEDARPHRVLRARLPSRGTPQRQAPAFPVTGVLPGGERHESPFIATFPRGEASHRQPSERAGFAVDDHLRIGKGP